MKDRFLDSWNSTAKAEIHNHGSPNLNSPSIILEGIRICCSPSSTVSMPNVLSTSISCMTGFLYQWESDRCKTWRSHWGRMLKQLLTSCRVSNYDLPDSQGKTNKISFRTIKKHTLAWNMKDKWLNLVLVSAITTNTLYIMYIGGTKIKFLQGKKIFKAHSEHIISTVLPLGSHVHEQLHWTASFFALQQLWLWHYWGRSYFEVVFPTHSQHLPFQEQFSQHLQQSLQYQVKQVWASPSLPQNLPQICHSVVKNALLLNKLIFEIVWSIKSKPKWVKCKTCSSEQGKTGVFLWIMHPSCSNIFIILK